MDMRRRPGGFIAEAWVSSSCTSPIRPVGAGFRSVWRPEPGAVPTSERALDLLMRADIFEQTLQQRYLGNKRFSLEGNTSLLPAVDEILDVAGERGALELVMGMSHRGRLNVIIHVASVPRTRCLPNLKTSTRAACWVRAT